MQLGANDQHVSMRTCSLPLTQIESSDGTNLYENSIIQSPWIVLWCNLVLLVRTQQAQHCTAHYHAYFVGMDALALA